MLVCQIDSVNLFVSHTIHILNRVHFPPFRQRWSIPCVDIKRLMKRWVFFFKDFEPKELVVWGWAAFHLAVLSLHLWKPPESLPVKESLPVLWIEKGQQTCTRLLVGQLQDQHRNDLWGCTQAAHLVEDKCSNCLGLASVAWLWALAGAD